MSKENELSGGQACLLLIVISLVIAWWWGYPAYVRVQVEEEFGSKHYQTYIVERVSRTTTTDSGFGGKTEIIILINTGDIIKESQFTDGAAPLIQAGDALDVVYDKNGKVEGARRTLVWPGRSSP